jgi:hypothetical protein
MRFAEITRSSRGSPSRSTTMLWIGDRPVYFLQDGGNADARPARIQVIIDALPPMQRKRRFDPTFCAGS